MNLKLLISVSFLVVFFSNSSAGNESRQDLLNSVEQRLKSPDRTIEHKDFLLMDNAIDQLNIAENVNPDNRIRYKESIKLCFFILNILNNKYNTDRENYLNDITNSKDSHNYKLALEVIRKTKNKRFYFCSSNIEQNEKLLQNFSRLRSEAGKARKSRNKEKYIEIYEKITNECMYDSNVFMLLRAYAKKQLNDKDEVIITKYNDLFLNVISKDQVEYDYGYMTNSFNPFFDFFKVVNGFGDYERFTKSEMLTLIGCIENKYAAMFDLYDGDAYNWEGHFDSYSARDGALAFANLIHWSEKHGLNEEVYRLTQRYFDAGFYEYLHPQSEQMKYMTVNRL